MSGRGIRIKEARFRERAMGSFGESRPWQRSACWPPRLGLSSQAGSATGRASPRSQCGHVAASTFHLHSQGRPPAFTGPPTLTPVSQTLAPRPGSAKENLS